MNNWYLFFGLLIFGLLVLFIIISNRHASSSPLKPIIKKLKKRRPEEWTLYSRGNERIYSININEFKVNVIFELIYDKSGSDVSVCSLCVFKNNELIESTSGRTVLKLYKKIDSMIGKPLRKAEYKETKLRIKRENGEKEDSLKKLENYL